MSSKNFEQEMLDKLKEHKLVPKKTSLEDPGVKEDLLKKAVELICDLEDRLDLAYQELAGDDY